jgi:hypothetical protein
MGEERGGRRVMEFLKEIEDINDTVLFGILSFKNRLPVYLCKGSGHMRFPPLFFRLRYMLSSSTLLLGPRWIRSLRLIAIKYSFWKASHLHAVFSSTPFLERFLHTTIKPPETLKSTHTHKHEGHLKSLWTSGSAPLLCSYASLYITATHGH